MGTVPIKNPFEDNSSESSNESQNSQDDVNDESKRVSSKTPTSTLKREKEKDKDKERPVSSCKSWYSQYSQGFLSKTIDTPEIELPPLGDEDDDVENENDDGGDI